MAVARTGGLLIAIIATLSCSGDPRGNTVQRLSIIRRDSNSFQPRIELSHALNAVAQGEIAVDTLSADLDLTAIGESPIRSVVDIATLADGRIAVLEWESRSVLLLGVDGKLISRFGRAGAGPGELARPFALTVIGNRIVVAQSHGGPGLTAFDATTGAATVSTPPSSLQWRESRGPALLHQVPTSSGIEDRTRRMAGLADSTILVAYRTQASNRGLSDKTGTEMTSEDSVIIMRFGPDLTERDTFLVAGTTQIFPDPATPGSYVEQIFGTSPLWAVGANWIARGHGRQDSLAVFDLTGRETLRVAWPHDARIVHEDDRITNAKWSAEYTMRSQPMARTAAAAMSEVAKQDQYRIHASRFNFADTAPAITAAYAAGNCLWMAGWNPADFIDGTALTWVIVHVASQKLLGAYRVSRQTDVRIRHITQVAVYGTYEDDTGQTHLVRYPVNRRECLN